MTKAELILLRRRYCKIIKRFFNTDDPNWLKRFYAFVGVVAGLASVYFAWLSIKLLTSDDTQKRILLKQDTVLSALITQNRKMDTSIIELKNQNEQLSVELSLLSKRYNFDSTNFDRLATKDYLNLKYSLVGAWTIVTDVITKAESNLGTFRKSCVDSLNKAIDTLRSQQDNNILLDNERMRLRWVYYQSMISNFISIDLRYNSSPDPHGNFIIKEVGKFSTDLDSLRVINGRFHYEIGTFISKRLNVVKSLQMPSRR